MTASSTQADRRRFDFGNNYAVEFERDEFGQICLLVKGVGGEAMARVPADVAMEIAQALGAVSERAEALDPTHYIDGVRVVQRMDGYWNREGHADRWPTKYGPATVGMSHAFRTASHRHRPASSASGSERPAGSKPWSAPQVSQGHGEADAARL